MTDAGRQGSKREGQRASSSSPASSSGQGRKKEGEGEAASVVLPLGLSNRTGQNHCFLNVVVQSLWSLSAFRDRFNHAMEQQQPPQDDAQRAGTRRRVGQALRQVFDRLGAARSKGEEVVLEEEQAGQQQQQQEEGEEGAVSVDALREALRLSLEEEESGEDEAGSGGRFKAGHMDDAVEALEALLACLSRGEANHSLRLTQSA